MKQRSAEAAMKAVDEATDQVVKDGGVIHEDSLMDAAEMALDGASRESIAERIRQAQAEPYKPRGGWRVR